MAFSWIATLALMQAGAPPATAAAPPPNDYALEQNWLCRPGRRDACTIERDATQVLPDGSVAVQTFTAAADPKVDCFYVYPTVSLDTTPNSDMVANDEERSVIAAQFARFGSVCRQYAPLYRQVTITALRALMTGRPIGGDRQLILADVRDAFRRYMEHDNGGRPFVLIGHSQGAGVLKELVQQDIDGKPMQKQMLSAMLIGTNIAVPPGKDVGGDFKSVPLCRNAGQTGCVISYVSFGDSAPPPANSRFGKVTQPGMRAACTNPAALGGTRQPVPADATMLDARSVSGSSLAPPRWTSTGDIGTRYVKLPGLVSLQCRSNDGFDWLAVTVNADPADARTDSIGGEVNAAGQVLEDWGLHLIDMNVAEGNLIGLVETQAAAYPAD